MKSFMSSALQETKPTNGATECNTCNGGAVRTAGQESAQPAAQKEAAAEKQAAPTQEQKENAVVVMQGPLGSVITEALNKSLSKKTSQAAIQVPTSANESIVESFVQANGQINQPKEFISRVSKSVGLVPRTDNKPTVVNTMLDAASKVDDIEFLVVEKVDADANSPQVPQKSIIQILGEDGNPANEEIAIESVQVVVTYSKRPKG